MCRFTFSYPLEELTRRAQFWFSADRLTPIWQRAFLCMQLAYANLMLNRHRFATAVSGISIALLVFLVQVAVLGAVREKVTQVFDFFSFDVVIVPDSYQFLLNFDTIDRIALSAALSSGEVKDAYGLNVAMLPWEDLQTQRLTYCLLLGLDEPAAFVRNTDVLENWQNLKSSNDLIMDAYSAAYVGSTNTGTQAMLNGNRVTVAGQFHLGQFFYSEGAAIVSNANFARLAGREYRDISLGLLQLNSAVDPARAKRDLQSLMPPHTIVMTRNELLSEERGYFLSTKPIGIMLYMSMLIACTIAAAIIGQVISTDIANRMGEYAVLKALGAEPLFVFGIAMSQSIFLGLSGLAVALLFGGIALEFIEWRTHLEVGLKPETIALVLTVTVGLAAAAGGLTARAIELADPADLY